MPPGSLDLLVTPLAAWLLASAGDTAWWDECSPAEQLQAIEGAKRLGLCDAAGDWFTDRGNAATLSVLDTMSRIAERLDGKVECAADQRSGDEVPPPPVR